MTATVSRIERAPHRRQGMRVTATAAGQQDIPAADWDTLSHAVCTRLTQLVAGVATIETRTGVLECVAALEQLHGYLAQDRARQLDQELQLFKVRASLAKARVELLAVRSNEGRSRRLAFGDGLTMLPNRSFFEQWLDHALVQIDLPQQPLAVLYLDLDGFKVINDTHGHDVGDELLRIVAARMARAVRAEDVVSRLGGDEFACVLTRPPGRDQLIHLARKLFDTVSAPVKIGPHELAVRPSIGIATCPADGTTAEALLRNADAAMVHARRQGSGFAFFDETCTGAMTACASRRVDVGR